MLFLDNTAVALNRRKNRYFRRQLTKLKEGQLDPRDWQALCLGQSDTPKAVYVPIPKAANTSIRTALKPCFGLASVDVENIHQDERIDKRSLKASLSVAADDAYIFTVVRHPAERIYSTYKNKLGWFDPKHRFKIKKRFGHASNLGIFRGVSFESFLEKLCATPVWAMDSHFKPQVSLLEYALDDPRLKIFHMESLADAWPQIVNDVEAHCGIAPDRNLAVLNRSEKPTQPFTPQEKRMIEFLFREDFETFGYGW